MTNPKGERLTITLHDVLSDSSWDLGTDPGLQKDGVEAHLQELLAASPHAIEDGLRLVRREYPTAIGPIDLVCRDADGSVVAIEVKRRGEIDGVEQLARYIERLHLDSSLGDVRGVFVAQVVKPQARVLAEARGLPLGRGRLRHPPRHRARRTSRLFCDRRTPAVPNDYLARPCRRSTGSHRPCEGRAGHHRDDRRARPRTG